MCQHQKTKRHTCIYRSLTFYMQVWSMSKIWACASHSVLATPSPSDIPAWYLLRLDSWQLSLKCSNSATELQGDSVNRAWQAICQVMGLSPSLSHCHILFHSFSLLFISHFLSYWLWLRLRSDCQIWSMSKIWATPPSPSHKIMNSSYHECVSNVIICRTLPEHMHHIVMYRPTNRGEDHSRDLVPRPRLDTMISALIGGLVTRLYTHFHNIKTPKNYYSLKLCLRKQICYCINQIITGQSIGVAI